MTSLPKIGAAMPSTKLPQYAEWLISGARDLEIQDPISWDVLDGDWRSVTKHINSVLDGYTGRIGIHGPFISLFTNAYDPAIRAVVSRRMLQALEFGAEIGATHMVIHSPIVSLGASYMPHTSDMNMADLIKATHATLEEALPVAEQMGCTLVIETIFDKVPGALMTLVKSFQSD